MPNKSHRKEEHRGSKQLRKEQNLKLFSLLGGRCVALASAVVQVYHADGNRWKKKTCGVGCFVKDNQKRSYYIRVYDLKSNNVIWEQEIYNQFKYNTPKDHFHTFEIDDCQAGLNFSSKEDAGIFKTSIFQKLEHRSKRRKERHRRRSKTNMKTSDNDPFAIQDKGKLKRNSKSKMTKAMVGDPKNFRHVGHVGWDAQKGFDMNQLDPEIKYILDSVGITEQELEDQETRDFIYEFIEQHGGAEALKRHQSSNPSLLDGGTSPPPLQPRRQSFDAAPPPLPGRDRKCSLPSSSHSHNARPPPLPSSPSWASPPPTPTRGNPAASSWETPPPLPPSRQQGSRANTVPNPPASLPPLVRPSQASRAPAAAPVAPPPPPGPGPPAPPRVPSSTSSPPQDTHLAAIRGGVSLKQVDHTAVQRGHTADAGNIATLLRNAITARTVHIHGADDSDSEDDFDGDEWSDG